MIKDKLKELTKHDNVVITSRGNTAIKAAVKGKLLIPEEGGWISYKKFDHLTVKCNNAKIDLEDLKKKVELVDSFIYQNPGGYFAEQPMEEIYEICKGKCKVIVDVSGGIGTKLCNGDYADFIVGSFGKWKLVEAGEGGFISSNQDLNLEDSDVSEKVEVALNKLPERIKYLTEKRKRIIEDLNEFNVLYPNDLGFVVVVTFSNDNEKEKLMKYCVKNGLEHTECPRYIRVNKQAISIEVKRL